MLLVMKNKNVVIILAVVVILIVLGGGYFLFAKKSNTTSQNTQPQDMDVVQTLSPDAIGLSLTASPDKKKVKFTVAKLAGIKSIEYQLTYEADATQEEKNEGAEGQVQRGITGDAKINSGDSSYESPWLDLGTCSSGTCRYDTGVTSVDLILKVTKSDGKVYQVEKKLNL